jgi:hypothetical protein
LPSLFETRRRLPTSATYIRRASNQTRALDPRRDGGLDLLPFLTCHAASLAGAMDTRRAALRPLTTTPVLVPPACASLPNRDVSSAPHHRAFARCVVRIDVHGSSDRVKDASPERRHGFSCWHRVHVRWLRVLDGVPLLGVRRTSAVIGAPFVLEEPTRGSGPTEIRVPTTSREGRRLPEDQDAFHRIERAGTGVLRKDCSLRPTRRLSRSRRPHLVSRFGRGALDGHCKVTVQSPASP